MVSTGLLLRTPPKAKRRPARSQPPAELMNSRLSKWGSAAVFTILRVTRPDGTSARNISIENRLFEERKTIRFPSGLSDGPTLSSPPFLSVITGGP